MNEETDRNATIKAIKAALQRRSCKTWSVTGGRGTAWGWIRIDAPPGRRTWGSREKAGVTGYCANWSDQYEWYDTGESGRSMSPAERQELATLLGLDKPVHCQGESIPASYEYRREYLQRARGETPAVIAQPYWD